ncbi:N-acetylglucosamine-6-phosphate deacetylase [Pirellula sp. SH-Sr6A]|uniref:N-acetylglucosamine-6-phosphate deacetylase n=1 Tax=Pirellula sp. SH-Sr6A TaxID=1632865 RepID=UPI00078B87EF|nr:N-acetylglucosamine-6-phosphate deacetylase [Pirellula sp. SH-Sr6A]AMV33940.1 N-acetylglucosamine-6-phosphate deacetylase [Pirellula sp. SH-Sr6A]
MRTIDIQVNGAFGIDFNDDNLDLDSFSHACQKLAASGVQQFFPTLITAPHDALLRRVSKIAGWVTADSQLQACVGGLHIEGPFISPKPGYRGTHPLDAIRPVCLEFLKEMVEAGRGLVRQVTLAPEEDPQFLGTRWLADQGIVPFAGHTDASLEQLRGAIDQGLQGFTHLGNGCALEVSRHDNILHRVLACRSELVVSFIADGIHAPFWLLKTWLELFGPDRVIVTSDAMSAAGMPPGEYLIGGQPILVDESRRTRHRDHQYLAGSASLLQDMENLGPQWIRDWSEVKERLFCENARKLFRLPGTPQ